MLLLSLSLVCFVSRLYLYLSFVLSACARQPLLTCLTHSTCPPPEDDWLRPLPRLYKPPPPPPRLSRFVCHSLAAAWVPCYPTKPPGLEGLALSVSQLSRLPVRLFSLSFLKFLCFFTYKAKRRRHERALFRGKIDPHKRRFYIKNTKQGKTAK